MSLTSLPDALLGSRQSWGGEGYSSKLAMIGAALTVAPIRFLTERVSAATVICSGQTCNSGDCCCKGFTAFCCQLPGGSNSGCPANTAIRGWWKCQSYNGPGLCANSTGMRFYMDCSQATGSRSCGCAGGSCSKRHTCCNNTPYVNCDPAVSGRVVCRLVSCKNPGRVPCTGCDNTGDSDPNTCFDDAPCLSGDSCCDAGHTCP
jgi:hypothetical protein